MMLASRREKRGFMTGGLPTKAHRRVISSRRHSVYNRRDAGYAISTRPGHRQASVAAQPRRPAWDRTGSGISSSLARAQLVVPALAESNRGISVHPGAGFSDCLSGTLVSLVEHPAST